MKRFGKIMLGMVLALAGMFVVPAGKSYAYDYGDFSYQTDDGFYENDLYQPAYVSSGEDIIISIDSQYTQSGVRVWHPENMYVKVCNEVTGNCTSTKYFGSGGTVAFTNMRSGKYWIYMYDNQGPSYYYYGDGHWLVDNIY